MLGFIPNINRALLPREFICKILRQYGARGRPPPPVGTFDRMTMHHFPPRLLGQELLFLIVEPLELLYALVMIVHSNAQHLFGALLAHDKLIQMLFERFRGYPRGADYAGATQRPASRLAGLIDSSEALT